MASRKITIKPDGSIVVIKGYKVAEVARGAGLRPTYSGSAGGWVLDLWRLPELVAWLEYRNIRYVVQESGEEFSAPVSHDTPQTPEPASTPVDDVELDLFGQVVG